MSDSPDIISLEDIDAIRLYHDPWNAFLVLKLKNGERIRLKDPDKLLPLTSGASLKIEKKRVYKYATEVIE